MVVNFFDLGQARADKDHSGVLSVALLNHTAVRQHRRHNRSHHRDQIRIILCDQRIDRRAAGGEDYRHFPVIHQLFIGRTDLMCTDSRFFHSSKTHPVKRSCYFFTGILAVNADI